MNVKSVLEKLKVIDTHDGQVSLTSLALMVVLVKLAIAPAVGLTEIGALFIALASYQGKKVINQTNSDSAPIDALKDQVDSIESKVSALSMQAGIKQF